VARAGFEGGEDDDDSRSTERTSTESNQEVYSYGDYNIGTYSPSLFDVPMSDAGFHEPLGFSTGTCVLAFSMSITFSMLRITAISKHSWASVALPVPGMSDVSLDGGCSKFYVSNLPVDIKLEELEDLFGKFGSLSDVVRLLVDFHS
jgi:hypothetical protein